MNARLAIVFYHCQVNRWSINALAGALEDDPRFSDIPLHFCATPADIAKTLDTCLATHDQTLVAVSFLSTQVSQIRKLLPRWRTDYPQRVHFAAGGPQPTADPAGTLALGFHAVIPHEGENAFRALIQTLAAGGEYQSVPGVASLDSAGRMRQNDPGPEVDLDQTWSFSPKHRRFGPVEITRGCPFGCAYCQTTALMGAHVRHRQVASIARHARVLARSAQGDVRFVTPNAFAYGSPDGRTPNVPALRELLHALRAAVSPRGRIFFGTFPSEVRPEHVTPETVALVRQFADNDNLVIGAQTGSPRLLELCRRGHGVEEIVRAVSLTREAGLRANVDFIFGLPGETEDDLAATIALVERLASMGARIHAHYFMPLPQTLLAGRVPNDIPPKLTSVLNRLMSAGALYGTLDLQRRHARELQA